MTVRAGIDATRGFSVAAALVLFGALLACGSGPKAKCDSAMELASVRYSSIGVGSSQANARKQSVDGTCVWYCQWGDPVVRSAYDRWKRAHPGAPNKPETIVTVNIRDDVKACEVRCAAAIKSGKAKVKTECL